MTDPTFPFDSFRERQDELNEMPSIATWKKLEKRLDQHQRRSRLTFRRHTAMAAAVLFLIGFTFLISFTLGKQSVFQGGMAGPVSVVEFEELSSEDTDLRSIQAVAIARKYIQTNDHYIQEGESNQKLRVKMQ